MKHETGRKIRLVCAIVLLIISLVAIAFFFMFLFTGASVRQWIFAFLVALILAAQSVIEIVDYLRNET
ncbi:MAG: hypothetical protein Q3985_07055 [Eubacteriales bacterium]|nr:hypothetical protein [Eubacteriales bacterium]